MPLNTQVKRGKKIVRIERGWDHATLSCFLTACIQEQYPDWEYQKGKAITALESHGKFVDFSMSPIYYMDMPVDIWKKGVQKLTRDHKFGPFADGSTVEFKKGDVLRMWRN
jgi:hypothetical protein